MSLSLEEERKLQEKCEEELKLYENMFRIASFLSLTKEKE